MKAANQAPGHRATVKFDRLIVYGVSYTVDNLHMVPDFLQPQTLAQKVMTTHTFYWGKASPLSQFYQSDFTIDGVTYSSVEQYMQYKIAILQGDYDYAQKMLQIDDPVQLKTMGRKIRNLNNVAPLDLDSNLKLYARTGNHAKFSQNKLLAKSLKDTAGTKLAEANLDQKWGIGLKLSDQLIVKKENWRGENWMGDILSQVRDDLAQA